MTKRLLNFIREAHQGIFGVLLTLAAMWLLGAFYRVESQAVVTQQVERNATDIKELRAEVAELVRSTNRWIGRVEGLIEKIETRTAWQPSRNAEGGK